MAGTANTPGNAFPTDPGFRRGVSMIVLWDTSCADNQTGGVRRNNRFQKLGHRTAVRGAAVGLFGESTSRAFLVDGQQAVEAVEPMSSILPFEPDNWTPRYHNYEPGKGTQNDSVWALRLVAEHQHKDNQVEFRSTMVIDNASTDDDERQEWGWLSDVLWVTDRRADVDAPGLAYTDAGFLSMLSSYVNDQDTSQGEDRKSMTHVLGHEHRTVVALNISRNAAFITDGSRIGQLSHMICWLGPDITRTGQPRPDIDQEIGLRADTGIKFGPQKIGRMVEDDADAKDPDDGEIRRVHLFKLFEDGTPDDKLDVGSDGNSNHKKIAKDVAKKKLGGWVKVPYPGTCEPHHYDWSYHHPPPTPSSSSSSSSGSGSSVATGGGGSTGTGSPTPPATPGSKDGRPGVPTVDRVYPSAGKAVVTTSTNALTMQAQHGWVPASSPGFTQRTNVLDKRAGFNTVGSMVATKAKQCGKIKIRAKCRLSEALPGGSVVELNVLVGAQEGNAAPSTFYVQSYIFDSTDDATKWHDLEFTFGGYKNNEEEVLLVLFERRNDTSQGTNADAELWIERENAVSQ